MRAWRPIVGPAGERCYYFSLRCGTDSASVRITNLCDWWSCDLDPQALEDQKREYGVQTSLAELLQILVRCFEEKEAIDTYRFELRQLEPPGPGHSLQLHLELTDSMQMEFACARTAEAERAVRVRDELLLPALLTLEQLDCSAVGPEPTAWEPPSGAATPSFHRPNCQQIFSWALAQASSVLRVPEVASAATDTAATSAREASPTATAGVAAGSKCPGSQKPTRPHAAPVAHPLAQGCPLRPR